MTKVLGCGGRHYRGNLDSEIKVEKLLDKLHATDFAHGSARGADEFFDRIARERGLRVKEYPADWDNLTAPGAMINSHPNGKLYNARAGIDRNQHMLDSFKPHYVIFLPGANGTAHMCKLAKDAGIPVFPVYNHGAELPVPRIVDHMSFSEAMDDLLRDCLMQSISSALISNRLWCTQNAYVQRKKILGIKRESSYREEASKMSKENQRSMIDGLRPPPQEMIIYERIYEDDPNAALDFGSPGRRLMGGLLIR